MNFLLDTNVVSDAMNARPNRKVVTWLGSQDFERLLISVLTIGEIRRGIEQMNVGQRQNNLRQWIDNDLLQKKRNQILPVTLAVAERWGQLSAAAKRTLPQIDTLIAATAIHHNLILVTRNTRDFQFPGLEIFDPFG